MAFWGGDETNLELRRGEREFAFIAGANDGGVRLLEVGTVIVPAHAEALQTSDLSSHLETCLQRSF